MSDPAILGKLESERLWDQAFEKLRDAIYAGRFEPGSVLSLRRLAETFGTSITPVRDAVSRLISLGVLERGARNAAIVPYVTGDALEQLTIVRCQLEGLAAEEAARRGGEAAAEDLAEHLRRMKALVADDTLTTYLDVHRDFHFKIYALAGNPILSTLIETLWLRFGPVLALVVPVYVKRLKTDHHATVVEAIRHKDSAQAKTAIIADIREAAAYLKGLAGDDGTIRRPEAWG
jgi:DNA-binding GntR family transcriptional regulator